MRGGLGALPGLHAHGAAFPFHTRTMGESPGVPEPWPARGLRSLRKGGTGGQEVPGSAEEVGLEQGLGRD